MATAEVQNKDIFKNWQLCSVWKLPFRQHRSIKLSQNSICFTNPCINLFVSPSVICEYHPKVLEALYLLQCMAGHLQHAPPWVSEETDYLAFLVLIFILPWSYAAIKRSRARWRPCWEDARSTESFTKCKQLILVAVTLARPQHVSKDSQSKKGKTKQVTLISDFHADGSKSSLWPIRLARS